MTEDNFQLAVLDLGGTTVRIGGIVERALAEALLAVSPASVDLPAMERRIAELGHLRGAAKIDLLRAALDGDETRAQQAVVHLEAVLLRSIDRGELEPMPGAADVFRWLHDRGVKVCLATGFPPKVRSHLLDALGWTDLVDLALSAEDGGRGRPHPNMILIAVLELAIEAVQQVVVVGDTVNDLIAGTRAGAGMVVGVLSGAHTRHQLVRAPHTHLIPDISELPDVLGG